MAAGFFFLDGISRSLEIKKVLFSTLECLGSDNTCHTKLYKCKHVACTNSEVPYKFGFKKLRFFGSQDMGKTGLKVRGVNAGQAASVLVQQGHAKNEKSVKNRIQRETNEENKEFKKIFVMCWNYQPKKDQPVQCMNWFAWMSTK